MDHEELNWLPAENSDVTQSEQADLFFAGAGRPVFLRGRYPQCRPWAKGWPGPAGSSEPQPPRALPMPNRGKGGSRFITPWGALVFGDVQLPDSAIDAGLPVFSGIDGFFRGCTRTTLYFSLAAYYD